MTKPIGNKDHPELYPALPDSIPREVWILWPRRHEAHIRYGVMTRVISTRVRRGVLKAYACPDETVRIPTQQLDELFGTDRSGVAKSDRAPDPPPVESKRRMSDAELELEDPLVGMFRECRVMLKEEREHSRLQLKEEHEHNRAMLKEAHEQVEKQLKLLVDPIGAATTLLQATAKQLADRVQTLEQRQDQVIAERELMADFRHVRDAELEQIRAREKRRGDIVAMLQKEFGPLIVSKLSGGTLADFVAKVSPELMNNLLESNLLPADMTAKLRGLVELQSKVSAAAAAQATNGASSAPS